MNDLYEENGKLGFKNFKSNASSVIPQNSYFKLINMKTQNKIGKMEIFIAIKLFFLLAFSTYGQEYKVKFNGASDRKVVMSFFNSDVKIEGYDGDEVVILAKDFEAPPKRADGLKSLSSSGVDNSGIGLSVTNQGNTIRISKANRQDGEYSIKIPKKVSLVYDAADWGGGDINISSLEGEVEVKATNADINLKNMSGPVVVNNVSGDITVVYSNYNSSRPSSISAVSGFVDITLPPSAKANFQLKTVSGEIYSGIDLTLKKKDNDLAMIGGNQIEGTLNGGGPEINVNAVSGDIYLRKGK